MTDDVSQETLAETVRLPPALARRIAKILEDPALGYGSFDDFVLSALRDELKRAERASYWLKGGTK